MGEYLKIEQNTMDANTIESILKKEFSVNFVKCTLTQCVKNNPIIYEGVGFVQQKNNKFFLQIFCTNATPHMLETIYKDNINSHIPGKLLNDIDFYDLLAVDQAGNEWISNRQLISYDCGSSIILTSDLYFFEKRIKSPTTLKDKTYSFLTPQKLELPWHTITKYGNQSIMDKFEFKSAEYEWSVQKITNDTEIKFKVNSNVLSQETTPKIFLYSLGILCGEHIQPVVMEEFTENTMKTTYIEQKLHTTKNFDRPIYTLLRENKHFHNFIVCCLRTNNSNDDFLKIYRFWLRMAYAAINDIENGSLILCVSIEGILKETFTADIYTDYFYMKEIDEAKSIIENIKTIGNRAYQCIMSNLGNTVTTKPQEKIRKLIEYNLLDSKHLKAWKRLRNAGAHGAMLDPTDENLQTLIDDYSVSLDLFFKLLFIKIGYTGKHIDRLDGSGNYTISTFTAPSGFSL